MKLGIIGAMEVEVATLRDQMDVERTVTRANMDFSEGVLNGCPAVVVRCGIGKVNAAACAQILADEFGVTHVVNTGVAGSLDNRIEIGDVVVSTDAVHHDMDVTGLGYAPGEVPQVGTVAFPANDGMRERAVEACHQVVPEIGVFEGRVASGDQFIAASAQKQRIRAAFEDVVACEMEGAAIGQVCYVNRVPCAILRAISDGGDEGAALDYPTFLSAAADTAARALLRFTEVWKA